METSDVKLPVGNLKQNDLGKNFVNANSFLAICANVASILHVVETKWNQAATKPETKQATASAD